MTYIINMQEIKKEAQEAAESMLKACKASEKYPINPFEVAENLGILCKFISAESRIAGGLLKEGSQPIIFINEADHPNRQRFTCAHELGHYYKRFRDQTYEYLDYRDDLSSTGTNEEEIFANNFAANLIMPATLVKQEFESLSEEPINAKILILSSKFKVSSEAMNIRVKTLSLV